jgi:hypothetical protein
MVPEGKEGPEQATPEGAKKDPEEAPKTLSATTAPEAQTTPTMPAAGGGWFSWIWTSRSSTTAPTSPSHEATEVATASLLAAGGSSPDTSSIPVATATIADHKVIDGHYR